MRGGRVGRPDTPNKLTTATARVYLEATPEATRRLPPDNVPEKPMRRLSLLLVALAAFACRDYDAAKYASRQDGLMPADDFAKYGPEQAVATAIGREYARAGADSAAVYAKASKLVKAVAVDSSGNRIDVTFVSGWMAQVNPIPDGKAPGETPGLTR